MSIMTDAKQVFTALWRIVSWVWWGLGSLLLVLLISGIVLAIKSAEHDPIVVPDKAALLLNPKGVVVEERANIDPLEAVFAGGDELGGEVVFRDLVRAIDLAAGDDKISSLVLKLDGLMWIGVSKTLELSEAIDRFRATGKPIVSFADYLPQDQYLLASQADVIILNPLGAVALTGFGRYNHYIKGTLEKLAINVHVFKAGEHKSVAEPLLRESMSPGEKEISLRWLNLLWREYTESVEQRRNMEPGTIDQYVDNYIVRLQAANGSTAQTALNAGLVDKLMDRQQLATYLRSVAGDCECSEGYAARDYRQYLRVTADVGQKFANIKQSMERTHSAEEKVAVVTAAGNIVDGEQPPGMIGGDTLSKRLNDVADRTDIKAVVLRVDSGGGSVFASELIRQAVLKIQANGIPVVTSMGSIAASGGYYIAASSDEIWATRTTITGSIGVFAAVPTFEDLLSKAGVSTDGVGTNELAGALRVDRPLSPAMEQQFASSVAYTYQNFLALVAEGRDMSVAEVDKVAQGRVWSAIDAKEVGLVDELGGLEEAISAAANFAGLTEYEIEYVSDPLTPREQILREMSDMMGQSALLQSSSTVRGWSKLATAWLRPSAQAVQTLSTLNDPSNLYVKCLSCEVMTGK